MKNSVKNLIEFIDHSPSCFHVIENARKQFMDHGFIELKEKEYWNLEEGKSYFVTRNGSSIIAFHLPKKDFQGFHIVARTLHVGWACATARIRCLDLRPLPGSAASSADNV